MSIPLHGLQALVTGASSGIGEATALALDEAGASLILTARRGDRLDDLVARIEAGGGTASAIVGDLTDRSFVHDLAVQLDRSGRGPDILINNAGLMLLAPADEGDLDEWRSMLDLNVFAVMQLVREVLPGMKRRRRGHIVNISSIAARMGAPNVGGYNASKWAVNGFSEAVRQEVAKFGIRVTVIEPGIVETELPSHITNATARAAFETLAASVTPLKAVDIAEVIRFCVTQPAHVGIHEVLLRPADQA